MLPFIMGYKRIKGSKLEKPFVDRGEWDGNQITVAIRFYYGADIQVFKGAHLEMGEGDLL